MSLSTAQGNEKAVEIRNSLEKRMTDTQLAEAQWLAREWRPQNDD